MNDRAEQRRVAKWEREDREARTRALRDLLSTRDGRKLVLYWLDICGTIGQNPFTGNALSTSFNCGQQNIGHQLLEQVLATSPDAFLMMLKEQEDERSYRNSASAGASAGADAYYDAEPGADDDSE